MNYYNEFDPKAAAWIRELIAGGHIPDGFVDERSIEDITPHDLHGFAQCHFFAGIGGWSYALQLAHWPEDRPVWTGSCPCQPFSTAGNQKGQEDERHLWPAFHDLIRQCRPQHVFGEQVANAVGHGWLDGISADLESEGYSCGAAVLGAHSVGAPHIRQRLYWVAITGHMRRGHGAVTGRQKLDEAPGLGEKSCGLDNSERTGLERLGFAGGAGESDGRGEGIGQLAETGGGHDFWSDYQLVPCRDGKARRIESGSQPLAHGIPRGVVPDGAPSVQEAQATAEERVSRLKGYGNAIVPQVAAHFIQASLEALAEQNRHNI